MMDTIAGAIEATATWLFMPWVVIALMGTAYIATARLDRISAKNHADFTSIEGERERFG